ncbi:MAG: Ig-like domain-containing protein [Clostridiales bacterium]|nr:Ig-like domain-containing protein [Clostridiales bacterium]
MKKNLSKQGTKILAVILALVVASGVFSDTALFGSTSVFAEEEKAAPELISYTITGTTLYQVDGVDVYQNVDGDDVTLSWVIHAGDDSWDASRMTLTIRNRTTGNHAVEICGDDTSIEWDQDGDLHTAAYTFDGDTDPANYDVQIFYVDDEQNAMVSADEALAVVDGTYTSEEFILDHSAPTFEITYSEAVRLVSDATGMPADDITSDIEGADSVVPTTGYAAYYDGSIDVTVKIYDDYIAVEEDDTGTVTALPQFTLLVNGECEDLPAVVWEYDETTACCTGEFTIPDEGDYVLTVGYVDAAGNIVKVGETVQGSAVDLETADFDGTYMSTQLIVDETAPVVDLAYGTYSPENGFEETDPSASYDDDDCSYFNEPGGIWLRVCVQDDHIRCAEVLDYLMASLTATDLYGDDITADTAAYLYLQEMMEQNAGEAVQGTLTLYIPFTDDAYYDLSSGTVTDLARNVSEPAAEQQICADDTMPEDDILAEYASDIYQGFTDEFCGLVLYREYFFGRQYIDVVLYLQDNLSGVQTISYLYNGGAAQTAERDGALADDKGDGVLRAKFTISLPVAAYSDGDDILINGNLVLTEITDRAGNVRTVNGASAEYTGDTELIIDNVNPDVRVIYPDSDDDGTYENCYFYHQDEAQSDEVVTLVYTERYFMEHVVTDADGYVVYTDGEPSPIYPTITVEVNGSAVEVSSAVSDTQPYVVWGDYNTSDDTIEAQLHLPYSITEDGAEIEYVIETEYADGSGNVLVRSADDSFSTISDDGLYRSGTLVLDTLAPELLSYTISGTTDCESDGVPVYRNVDGGDVTLNWVICDNDKYWNPSDLTVTIRNVTTGEISVQISGNDESIEWDRDGKAGECLHTAEYTFDGDENPANYFVEIYDADRAGNVMISGNEELTVESGIYQSGEFILDHAAPVFNIRYTKAYRLVKDSDTAQSNDKKNAAPTTGYTAYYSTDIEVTIEITEDYALVQNVTGADGTQSMIGLTDYTLQVGGILTESYTPECIWSYDEDTKTCTVRFTLTEEDGYNISVSYTDAAGNVMTKGGEVQGSSVSLDSADLNGSYVSTALVIDRTAPQITGTYGGTVIDETAGRYYFNRSTTLTLTVTDANIRNQELKDAMSADRAYAIENSGSNLFGSTSAYASLNALDGKTIHSGQDRAEYTLSLSTQANYDLLITGYEDLAGNTAVITDYNPYVCVDTAGPTDVTFTYSVNSAGTWEAINYAKLGYVFANSELTVQAAVKDATAGLKQMTFYVTDENGTVTVIERSTEPAAGASETIILPVSGDDFRGSVEVVVTDWSGNTGSKTEGQIVQSAARHASAGRAAITTLTSPSRTVNGVDYYNTDVTFNLTMKETYAGLRSCSYTAGSLISETIDYSAQAGYDLTQSKSCEITDTFSANLTLLASANNQNDVSVQASYVDNTGYTGSVSRTYHIDITKPTIEVTYDNNRPANGTYYSDARTATVVITERNFDADDVVFTITSSDGAMPAISGWTTTGSGDATKHTATVTFSADSDYTFAVSFQDLAGNKADDSATDQFTIDRTVPTCTVTYDNNSSQNEYYYDADRVATIDILEHNFDASDVTITVSRDGSDITPEISGWVRNGDHHIAAVSFHADGEYTFTISGADLAANPMDDYTMDYFVIDTESPEVEIYNIENYSANNGVVQPGVRCSDINCDTDTVTVEIVGYYNGVIRPDGRETITSDGMEILMDDFEYVREMDDMYTMTATVCDLAGNRSEAAVTFSVNRFGSVYTFDSATNALVGENGSYYTNEEPTIVVIETNVDILKSCEIARNLNGDLSTLEEDEDYTVKVSGDDVSWKQYTYTLDSSDFETEGEYILTFMSQDRAANYNTNEKQIGFVVDKTAPTVLVSGITDGEQLREETHDIVISAADNVRLDSVTVINDGESSEYDAADVTDGSFTHTLSSKDERQTLQVIAADAAGNKSTVMSIVDESGNVVDEMEELHFLLTPNLRSRFVSDRLLPVGVMVMIAAVVILLFRWFLFGRKRRKKGKNTASI